MRLCAALRPDHPSLPQACISVRSLYLARNLTLPGVAAGVAADRSLLESTARAVFDMHTLNYVASPSQGVTNYFLESNLVARTPVPGSGAFQPKSVNFWDLVNQFVMALLSSSAIPLNDLQDSDYTVNHMSLDKRAVAFV